MYIKNKCNEQEAKMMMLITKEDSPISDISYIDLVATTVHECKMVQICMYGRNIKNEVDFVVIVDEIDKPITGEFARPLEVLVEAYLHQEIQDLLTRDTFCMSTQTFRDDINALLKMMS